MLKDLGFETPRSTPVWDLLIWFFGVALLALLVISYATGEQYPDTHKMIGYTMAIVVGANIFWLLVTPRHGRVSPMKYTPGTIRACFQNADRFTKTVAFLVVILAALPFSALLIMLFTHTVWGTTNIDEMHEVVVWFTVRFVALYVVMVGVASSGYIEAYFRRVFGKK